MCFKPKKPPPVLPDTELLAQNEQQKELMLAEKTKAKQRRMEDSLAMLSGTYGRASLLSGSAGGAGFAMPLARSLFAPNESMI
jgi:hypothetical protein